MGEFLNVGNMDNIQNFVTHFHILQKIKFTIAQLIEQFSHSSNH